MDQPKDERIVDLTRGSIVRQVVLFSLPILAGYIFQTLYNNVDSLVVGNFIGKEALAAVNTCTPVYNLLVGFFNGTATGASVVFSRSLGAGNLRKLREAIHTTALFALIAGVLLGVLGVFLAPLILRLMNCPPDIREATGQYLRVYIAGIVFTAFYNVGAAVLRSVGDSRSPFYALVASSLINIALDVVFVWRFHWGVAGAAVATVIAQMVSVTMVLRRMRRMDVRYRLYLRELRIRRPLLREVLGMGLPAGVQSGLIALSNLLINRYINGFGSSLMAGVGVAQKIDRFALMPCEALGLAITTFTSQNIGARKPDRIRKGVATCLLLGFGCVSAAGALIALGAVTLMRLFNRDPEVVAYGAAMMRILAPTYAFSVLKQVIGGMLRGFGYSRLVTALSLLGMIAIRQAFLAVFLRTAPSPYIIFIGYPVGWCSDALLTAAFTLALYRRGKLAAAFSGAPAGND